MANVLKGRGSLLKLTISASLTSIAQVKSINIGQSKSICVDTDTLDASGAGIQKTNTLEASQDDITASVFYDSAYANHQFVTDTILAPSGFPVAGSVVFTDPGPLSATFSAVGFGFSASVETKNVWMGEISIETTGLVTWPT